uniref:Uncharacterized protein n=1 Tax=Panagrolaimus sp. PS1159 TaxID=55785 RepID=A0AC35F5Z2_9BILA
MAFELGEIDDKISYFDKFAEFQMFHPRDLDMRQEDYYFNKKLYFNSREYNEFYEKVYRKNKSWLKNDLDLFVQALQYPHCDLDEIWSKYEFHSISPPSKVMQQKYNMMKKLYARIKLTDENGDIEEWFNAVIESEHGDSFVQMLNIKLAGIYQKKVVDTVS